MVVLDGTIVNIALPHIQTDLDFSPANLSWVVNAYTLAFGGLLLLGGRAGDLLGRRKVFMAGVGLFALASLAGGIAQTSGQMLAARIVQGVGAAIASPTALSLITTTFPAGRERNRAFGVYAAMSGAGAAIGLILGGVLTEVDWRLTFFINVPIGALVLFMAPRFLGESDRETGDFDLPGAVTATGGLVALVYGLTHAASQKFAGADDAWTNAQTLGFIGAGVVLLVAFLVIESRSKHALMPFRILAHRTRGVSLLRDAARRRRDVRDVLLPRPLHPADPRLRLAEGRLRVPAVQPSASSQPPRSPAPSWPASTRAGSPAPAASSPRSACSASRVSPSSPRTPGTCCRSSSCCRSASAWSSCR
ncbi:hypothetical protein GCM10025868_00130 [Angustibacter aerolatus]|uniref:Major facilitator superfamily (MFS) profile domain-containing protein n=1 Tax=Angustibacter aerolatus TaxID=1162965 RepID=A0ABQ6J9A2_9ACTN|nr:hypothetical protein GCM10025868_00130 [Angustibacter aerolatus]